MPAQTISINKSQMLKGLAILAVVLIHVFSNFKGIYTTSEHRLWYIGFDQLMRFCVPLFLMLSGYGLAIKYSIEDPQWITFFKSRTLKLIPLYLLWSFFSYFLFMAVPGWDYSSVQESIFYKLLYGRADYHLYFLPLIFQLYLFFPIILWLMKRLPVLTLVTAFLIQIAMYEYYASALVWPIVPKWALTDSLQYLFFASWIGYFALGIYLALKGIPERLKPVLPAIAIAGSYWAISSAFSSIVDKHIDPLISLKFTKISIIGYTVPAMMTLMIASAGRLNELRPTQKIKLVLKFLGEQSYVIFLSHTIALRMYNSILHNQLPLTTVLIAFVIWCGVIFVSKKIS